MRRLILFGGCTKQFTSSSSFLLIFIQYPAKCFNVMPSGFALIFVECFIRARLLGIIDIELDGPPVVLPESSGFLHLNS